MKLTTYYAVVQTKTIYRVIVDDGRIGGYFATPNAPRWHESGSVEHKLQAGRSGAVKITRDDALTVLTSWGGSPDDLDGGWVSMPEFVTGAVAARLETPRTPAETLQQDWSVLTKPAPTPPPRRPLQPVRLEEPFELWRQPDPIAMPAATAQQADPPPMQREVLVDRPAAFSALRDLAEGLSSLGQPGVGWT